MPTNPRALEREFNERVRTGRDTRDVELRLRAHFPFRSLIFSWIGTGLLSKVRDQKSCSCCWVIVTEEATQALYKLQNPKLDPIDLSVQEVVDCYKERYPEAKLKYDKVGCFPRNLTSGFEYLMGSVTIESKYEFKAKRERCKVAEVTGRRYCIEGYESISEDPKEVFKALDEQPLAAWMRLFDDLRDLEKEIYMGPREGVDFYGRHAVLVVGHGIEDDVPYYLILNSFGKKWGINGFGKIKQSLIKGFRRPTGEVTSYVVC